MKPWREIAVPHEDVLKGTFQQSEFAVDISAVRKGNASQEYQKAGPFFERTYITEGMRLLLSQVAQRLNGRGGEPVVQLQTAFGGGKTHTMLAVYHLANREESLNELAGIPALLDHAGVMDIPRAKVAILDGNAHAPGQPWTHEGTTIHTLWGELAWQLGGLEGYELVRAADTSGTSPGKDVLHTLLKQFAPCVILIDELVAYIRQFVDGRDLPGGTYDSNLSFIQALTESVKFVPNAILLATLPESEIEAGSGHGVSALRALEKTFGRVQALWKPVATEESFEIVRRRLFEPIHDLAARDAVCRAFADLYLAEGARMPSETQESRYFDRLVNAYPIHPEVFDRLYEDWSVIESFQRTRGVLKLMANVIHELWAKDNKDLLILPGSLPLYRGKARDELLNHLPPGWDPVLDRDVDDDKAESADLDRREARFGAVQAARRVTRATFFGSAPSSASSKNLSRGVDRAHILLGCLQPSQTSSLFSDALNRLADRLHHLNASGDKLTDSTRFWFDIRANLRREMEDRKNRIKKEKEMRDELGKVLAALTTTKGLFDGVHPFTPHADVPDDSQLRLVILPTDNPYAKQTAKPTFDVVQEYVRNNGSKPRFKGNRLMFLAADEGSLGRLQDAVRTTLAWQSIVSDIDANRLVIDNLQRDQARKEAKTAEAVVNRATRDCYKWLLCPMIQAPTDQQIQIEAFALNTSAPSLPAEIDRVCQENELIITVWSPIHLRSRLQQLYWKADRPAVKAAAVWEDMQRYLYLPRLKNHSVYQKTVATGAEGTDFFGVAYGQDGDKFDGFSLGASHVQVDDTLLLIEPKAAEAYQEAQRKPPESPEPPAGATQLTESGVSEPPTPYPKGPATSPKPTPPPVEAKSTAFFGAVEINAATAKMKLVTLAEEIINVLTSDPGASVQVTVEIKADFPNGVPDHIKRAINENTTLLGFKIKDWE